jgi:23S rRNA pseudouridine1911/1915/1917 synthase
VQNETIQFTVADAEINLRLDKFVYSRMSAFSRMYLAQRIAEGECFVNELTRRSGHKLSPGDNVSINVEPAATTAMTAEPLPLDIVFEDDQIIVVNKPSGMLVHPTNSDQTGTLANALAYHMNRMLIESAESCAEHSSIPKYVLEMVRPGLVHRLDRGTSGLILVAKNERALRLLGDHFKRRLVEKTYIALVHGVVERDELFISAPIGRDENVRPQWNVMESGKHAETKLRVIDRRRDTSLVEMQPLTGRTNQLRIHCRHLGHIIVGDKWYGSQTVSRLCLHASRLAFHHPSTNEWVEFESKSDHPAFAIGADKREDTLGTNIQTSMI